MLCRRCRGISTDYIKVGAPWGTERTAQYNQLLRIEEDMDFKRLTDLLGYVTPLFTGVYVFCAVSAACCLSVSGLSRKRRLSCGQENIGIQRDRFLLYADLCTVIKKRVGEKK